MFILIFILALMVLVLSHELGHFLLAKKFNVKVLEFGFGIPPKLFSKKVGETKYSLNLLPIGGFVRLLGEDEVDQKVLNNPRSFVNQKVGKRIAIVAGGVVMNLLFAWLLFYIILFFQDFRIIYPTTESVVVIAEVLNNGAAQRAGIKVGDRLYQLNGERVESVEKAAAVIKSHPNQALELVLADVDGGNLRELQVTPEEKNKGEGLIGVAFSPVPFKSYSTPIKKVFSGVLYSYDLTKLTFVGLGKLVTDVTSGNLKEASQNVAGPVGLIKISQSITSLGIEAVLPYLWFLGVISLTLAIFNSLPVPALDGGRLAFLFYEAVTRKKPNPALEKLVHNIGMAVLLAMIALITISDIKKLF